MPDAPHHELSTEQPEPRVSISHIVQVLRDYSAAILLSMAAVIVGYLIIALGIYLLGPAQRVTTLPFRLEFEGAERGVFPNRTKFSSAEIISTPVLLAVFNQNDLGRFTSFNDFTRTVVVLESNRAQDALSRDYLGRLSDPRLVPIDRERINREYESKLASLSKSQYALHYLHPRLGKTVPPVVIEKVLQDILKEWARFVSRDQHVLEYQVAVLAPDVVSPMATDQSNPIVVTEVLRSRLQRVIANIDELRALPSAELIRSGKEGLSLADIRIRLDDMIRFGLEPLTRHIASAGLDDRADTIQFLEAQLAYDQRQLDAQQRVAEAARNSLAMYMNGQNTAGASETARMEPTPRLPSAGGSETVMPQLGDSFIERLIAITSSTTDQEYRQRRAEEYHEAAVAAVPLERAVAHDQSVLDLVRRSGGGHKITREIVDQQINATRSEARTLIQKVNQIYQQLSVNLNPSTELMTITGAPTLTVQRSIKLKELALFGLLTWLVALPVIAAACLLHNRIREEKAAQQLAPSEGNRARD